LLSASVAPAGLLAPSMLAFCCAARGRMIVILAAYGDAVMNMRRLSDRRS
jgi:hypothetical protein